MVCGRREYPKNENGEGLKYTAFSAVLFSKVFRYFRISGIFLFFWKRAEALGHGSLRACDKQNIQKIEIVTD